MLTFFSFFYSEPEPPQGITENGGLFFCLNCGHRFTRKGDAVRHYKNLHNSAQATCHICKKVFKNVRSRDDHRAKFHGITKSMMRGTGAMVPEYEPKEYFDGY